MQSVITDYKTRVGEIETYFKFLSATSTCKEDDKLFEGNHDQVIKTLKANSYLLLYNLIESTVRNAIEAIYDEFQVNGIRYDNCSTEVQKTILTNLRKRNIDKIHPNLTDLSLNIVFETFEKSELFSGNVDARKIRETAQNFGFNVPDVNGEHLLSIKTNRNFLAHGDKSFADVGRDCTIEDLLEMKDTVANFLYELLELIEEYLKNKKYTNGL